MNDINMLLGKFKRKLYKTFWNQIKRLTLNNVTPCKFYQLLMLMIWKSYTYKVGDSSVKDNETL